MPLHTLVFALIGAAVTAAFAHIARRHAVSDRLDTRVERRGRTLPRSVRVPLARAIHDAASGSTPEEAVEVWLFVACIAAMVGFGLAPAGGVLAGSGALVAGPILLRAAGQRRTRMVAAAVPDALDHVGGELRVGGTVRTALATIASGNGPLASDITRVEARVRLGASLPDALHAWARERPVAGVEATSGALALSATVGGRAADALEALASSLRERLGVAAEARALSAQARYSAWVIGIAPLAYLVMSAAIDPRSTDALLGTGVGRICALSGVGLEVAGAAWMRAIVRAGELA